MSSLTGYYLTNGIQDLRYVFKRGQTTTKSGFLLSDGRDLSDVFTTFSTNAANKTGYILTNGNDLNTLYENILPCTFVLTRTYTNTSFFGISSANNGVGYLSFSVGNVGKTTDYGATWTTFAAGVGERGIASNASNTMLIQGYSAGTLQYSTNGAVNWTSVTGSGSGTQACFIPRNNPNNPIIYNRNGVAALYISNSPYTSITVISTPTVVANVPTAACISDVSNYIYVNFSSNASKVYRNTTNGDLFSALYDMTSNVVLGTEANNLFSSCCNSAGTVNLIVGRPGTIYRSTSWNGTFTRIANSPSGNFRSVSTSASGNIVCAVAETAVYVSFDSGLTFTASIMPALSAGEVYFYGSVSPDETFIIVASYINSLNSRVFTCTL